jgi:hypothetical protein
MKHKCMGNGKTLSDVLKEMAEQEALERGTIILLQISMIILIISVDKLFFTARRLSLMANEPNNQGQSSRSECFIKIEPMI